MPISLQEKMFHEMEQKEIFRQAQRYAFDYADNVLERNVFPTVDAIANLDKYIEKLPGPLQKMILPALLVLSLQQEIKLFLLYWLRFHKY